MPTITLDLEALRKRKVMVSTLLHKNCGGQVMPGTRWSYKTVSLKHDGSLGCCLCGKQPLTSEDTFEGYR